MPNSLAALLAVYAFGHVAGSLLVNPRDDRGSLSWSIIRLIAGLLLTTVSFFLSLLLALPWFVGPAGVLAAAVAINRRKAWPLPRPRLRFHWDAAAAGVLAAVLLSPLVISAARMAPGDFAPVFYNVDTAYFLEQVQSLTKTSTYPPVVLASLAAVAAAPVRGWRLPVFLIGIGILVKTSAGVALVAGFLLVELWQAVAARRFRPSMPAAAVIGVFAATYLTFWAAPSVAPEFAIEPFALFHLSRVIEREALTGFVADLVWMFLPILIVVLSRVRDAGQQSLPLLLYGLAPFIVVNVTRSIDVRPGGGGASDDWLQVLLPVPFVLHAFALGVASRRWAGLRPGLRAAFLFVLVLTILPTVLVAGRYARVLIVDHQEGHEFVDNRAIAAALAAIPTDGTIIVTNDLRHPAQRFSRDNRQMQIPALFGHQAFAVNFAYEVFEFSRERHALQPLLQAEQWSDAIDEAARLYGWTHLLIRRDYAHPASIPLEQIFVNEFYEVYRF